MYSARQNIDSNAQLRGHRKKEKMRGHVRIMSPSEEVEKRIEGDGGLDYLILGFETTLLDAVTREAQSTALDP